jgi:hypothetical protein
MSSPRIGLAAPGIGLAAPGIVRIGSAVVCSFAALVGSGAGCSNDPKARATAVAPDAAASPNRPAVSENSAPPETCRESCDKDHGAGSTKNHAVDACWQTHCATECVAQTPSDAGAADAGTCTQPVVTVSNECDSCTRAFCCTEWDDCFGDAECSALNACYQTCAE